MNPFSLVITAVVWVAVALTAQAAETSIGVAGVDLTGEPVSADARLATRWIAGNADNQRLPFVVVDKKNTRVFVFGADGVLRGSTQVLLGRGIGDESVPDIANRQIASLRPEERTTPAGRFMSEPGHNLQGEDIVWVDYDARIAIHRLRPDAGRERRAQRMVSGSSDDKRISAGCIVVPVNFYENVIRPVLGKTRGVVYVLPETRSLPAMLSALQLSQN